MDCHQIGCKNLRNIVVVGQQRDWTFISKARNIQASTTRVRICFQRDGYRYISKKTKLKMVSPEGKKLNSPRSIRLAETSLSKRQL